MTARVLRRLLTFSRPHAGLLALAFACMVVLGATTGLYAYLMGPALRFLLEGGRSGLGMPARLFPALEQLDRGTALWLFPVAIVAIGVLKGLSYLGQFYWMGLYGQKVVGDLRRAVFWKLASLSPLQLARERTGDLLSRFTSDVAAVEAAATYAVASYLRDGLQIAILVGVALFLDWRIAGFTLLVLPLAVLPAARLTRSVLRRTRDAQAQLGEIAAQIKEGLSGLRTIQAFNAEAAERARFATHAGRHQSALIRAGWARGAVPGVMELLAAGALALGLGYAVRAQLPPEHLVSVLTAVVLIYQPAKDLGRVSQFALQAAVAGERIFQLLDADHPVPPATGLPRARRLSRELRLEDVWFKYGDRPALEGCSFSAKAGQITALVGPSGAGKSTVTQLLLRFTRPDRGRIFIDGEDVERYAPDSVRESFALVTQESLLFSTTVLENVRFARPDASPQEVEAAARIASAHDFIQALPKGYGTPVGERGVVLSGGQKQRLCLARAVLAGAPVLVLDEATSNLDPESEAEVRRAMDAMLRGRTALVIAHRLSTVRNADLIHVIDRGRVVESGTHAELLRAGGLYARLWELQESGAPRSKEASVA
ncbi:MAG TPA: ABC transporter ATP-binding protein [Myxococcaceae bacterium]|nr:ABC transporter ATP-binding protein [Myxococcaceae bacterium]